MCGTQITCPFTACCLQSDRAAEDRFSNCLFLFFSPFPVRLENPHVIEQHQMLVGVVTKAPDGATLNSSYETRYIRQ